MKNVKFIIMHGGKKMYPLRPVAKDFTIDCIAHSLSQICRFAGGTIHFYSVAQHSVLMSMIVPAPYAKWALLHDAAEMIVGDVPTSVKYNAKKYVEIENNIIRKVAKQFGLKGDRVPDQLQAWDHFMAVRELQLLIDPTYVFDVADNIGEKLVYEIISAMLPHIVEWPPKVAEECFLDRYYELWNIHPQNQRRINHER